MVMIQIRNQKREGLLSFVQLVLDQELI
ncbi:hypothetical protein ID866_11006 [Astraeus odoratus]|nr:hypothetical protein ID866_11006 [Astraeus odoratus]